MQKPRIGRGAFKFAKKNRFMLKLPCLYDFTGLKTFYAYCDALAGAVDYGTNALKVRHESASGDAGDLHTDAALLFSKASTDERTSCDRFFSTDRTDLCHWNYSYFDLLRR